MTVDRVTEPQLADSGADGEPAGRHTRPYVQVSLGFLALALLLGTLAAVQLLAPGFLAGVEFLSYGRVRPMATDAFLFGWLTIGLAGAALYVTSRAGGSGLPSSRAPQASLGLLALGVLVGTVAIGLGFNEGRRYLEYPLWADALILLGLLGVARTVSVTARAARRDAGPVRWYAVAATWWLVIAFAAGNVPGLGGVAGTYQTSFFRAAIVGLWLASAGVAAVYFVVPRLAGRDAFTPTRLTLLGFWSLAFVWALTAPADLVYSPAPDWVETLGAVFSIGLLIPVAVIFTDVVLAMRRRWDVVTGDVTLRFVMLGAALFALWPVLNLAVALRASSALVQFTDWIDGLEAVGFYGAFTAWLVAYTYHVAPEVLGHGVRHGLARLHYFGTALGLVVWVGASLIAGLTAGWTWVASANEATVPQVGTGFVNTIAALDELYAVRFVGVAVFVLAQVAFLVNVLGSRSAVAAPQPSVGRDDEPDPELVLDRAVSPARLRAGAVGLAVGAALLVWVIPAWTSVGVEGTILADTARTYPSGSAEAEGRTIYLQEGCWYCHTQQVRAIVTDVGLGPVSAEGDYVHEDPVLFGVQRIGPDLMHVGSRTPTDDLAWLVSYLADPRGQRAYSSMPSYDHLSASELESLAAYLVSLK